MFKFIIFIILTIFILHIIQHFIMIIMLGYCPARYALKNIEGEIRIYHNGLSNSQCIDEHEYTMSYYYVPSKWIAWMYFNIDPYLNYHQKNAIQCRNLKDIH